MPNLKSCSFIINRMSSSIKTVVINGAGIGGLALASLLRRIRVNRIIVVERSFDVCRTTIGSGIGLWPNAFHVLDLIGGSI